MILKTIRRNLFQTFAIIEKNVRLQLRYKMNLIINYISQILGIILPIIIMSNFFNFKASFGSWSNENFLVYQFIAFNIGLIKGIMGRFPSELRQEQVWFTLPGIIIAPFNNLNLLFGIFLTHLTFILIPFIIFFAMCYLYYPISIITIMLVIGLFLLVALIFSGIGILLGIFATSKYKYLGLISFFFSIFFLFSCITYPFEIFPEFFQNLIALNPLYYIFDILRLTWIEDNIIFSITTHFTILLFLISFAIIFPSISIFLFIKFYKKYGIIE